MEQSNDTKNITHERWFNMLMIHSRIHASSYRCWFTLLIIRFHCYCNEFAFLVQRMTQGQRGTPVLSEIVHLWISEMNTIGCFFPLVAVSVELRELSGLMPVWADYVCACVLSKGCKVSCDAVLWPTEWQMTLEGGLSDLRPGQWSSLSQSPQCVHYVIYNSKK